MTYYDRKRGDREVVGWAVSSRFFDILNSMIYDLKISVDLRRLFDPVLHSSLDDLVLFEPSICYKNRAEQKRSFKTVNMAKGKKECELVALPNSKL